MRRKPIAQFLPLRYVSSGLQSIEDPQIMAEGSRNVLLTALGKPNAFKGMLLQGGKSGSRIMMQAGDSYAGLGSYAESGIRGSIARVMAGLFFAGSGTLYYDGLSLGASASSILQLKLLASGAYGPTYQAGLSQPNAPTIATRTTLGTGMTGKLKAGTYTIKVYKIRSATGARSNASPASNFVVATESNGIGQSMRVSLPAADSNGGDRWGICVTPRNFGTTGPYFLLQEVAESALSTIDSVPRSIEIEWSDGDLVGKPLAPVDSSPPPSCVFVGALGNSVFVDGCYGDTVSGVSAASPGTVIACSLPLRPEEFPLDWLAFPPDAPTGHHRGGDGFIYRFGKNSMGVISYTGGEPSIAYQMYWGTTGISYQHNAVVAEGGRLYAKTANRNLVRIGDRGEPDTSWAADFADDMESLSDIDTVMGWDENSQNVCVFNDLTCWPFNSAIERCGAPIDLTNMVSGKVVSAVSHLGALYISCLDNAGSSIKVYQFNAGTGSVMEVYTDWHFSEAETDYLREIEVWMRSDSVNPVTLKVFKNEDLSAPVLSTTLDARSGAPLRLDPFRGLVPDLRSFCIYLSQLTGGGNAGFELIKVQGYSKGVAK